MVLRFYVTALEVGKERRVVALVVGVDSLEDILFFWGIFLTVLMYWVMQSLIFFVCHRMHITDNALIHYAFLSFLIDIFLWLTIL